MDIVGETEFLTQFFPHGNHIGIMEMQLGSKPGSVESEKVCYMCYGIFNVGEVGTGRDSVLYLR